MNAICIAVCLYVLVFSNIVTPTLNKVIIIIIIMIALKHVIFSCKSYLDEGRVTWRHSSVLFVANTFSSLKQCTVYADLPSFLSQCFITGESFRSDLLRTDKNILYILELTVGYETNMQSNSDC